MAHETRLLGLEFFKKCICMVHILNVNQAREIKINFKKINFVVNMRYFELYRLARQRDRAGKDVQHVRVIKDENGNVMVNSEAVLKRWKEYFEKLMNKENNRDPRTEEAEVVHEEVNCVSREEVKNALRRMKKGKAVGPDELPVKFGSAWERWEKFLTRLFNKLLMGKWMPEEWRRSVLIPIYKKQRGRTVLWKLQRNKANEPHNEGMGKNY